MDTVPIKTYEYDRPQAGLACTAEAWARIPSAPELAERNALKDKIRRLLKEKGAVLADRALFRWAPRGGAPG